MKKFMIILSMLMISIVSFAGYESDLVERMRAYEEKSQKELDTGVNMTDTMSAIGQKWDEELNKIYKLLMSKLSTQQKTKLRNEEKAWIAKRDKDAKKAASQYEGQIKYMTERNHQAEANKKRAIELAKRYDNLGSKK